MARHTGEFDYAGGSNVGKKDSWVRRHPVETATLVGGLIGFGAAIWAEQAHILPTIELGSLDITIPHIVRYHFYFDAVREVGLLGGGLVGEILVSGRR